MKNFYILATLLILLFSCKKEYPDSPYADLQQFIIKDAKGNDLKAAINGEEVILYWPPFQEVPDSISPVTVISERASISPVSGKKVPFNNETSYTVTAQNGTTKQYKLKLALNQLKPDVSMVSSALVGTSFALSGDFFIPDTARTKVFVIDNKGKDIQLKNVVSINQLNIWFYLPELEEGSYKVKMISGIHTVIVKGELAITYSATPSIDNNFVKYPIALKKAGAYQYRITGTPVSKITKIRMKLLSDNSFHEVEIKSRNADNTVLLKIPDTMPPGTYSAFEISSSIIAAPFVRNLGSSARIVVSD